MKLGKILHKFLLGQMKSKTTGELHVKGSLPPRPVLIVANHVCIEDIPTLAQAVDKYFYLLVSDEDKFTVNGFGLTLNGVYWISRLKKKSRQKAAPKAVKILKSGENFAMYPEATWNLSPNLLILPMNYGCIRIALSAGVPIVPVVSFFAENERYSIIGEEYYPSDDLKKSIIQLRDAMATMIWEEMEENLQRNRNSRNVFSMTVGGKEYFYETRSNIPPNYWDKYIDQKYEAYPRSRNDKAGVRKYESQFIFCPKDDAHQFFIEFNSAITKTSDGKTLYKRISSEKDGYQGENLKFSEFFE